MSFLEKLLAAHYSCEYRRPQWRAQELSDADPARIEQLLSSPISTDIPSFDPHALVLLCEAAKATGCSQPRDRAAAILEAFFALPNWRLREHRHMNQVELGMAVLSARLAEVSLGLRSCAPDLSGRAAEAVIARGLEPFCAQVTDPDRPGWVRMYMNWKGYICGDMGRAAFLLQGIYPRWRDCVAEAIKGAMEVADVGGEDGDWEEGIGYWGMCFGQIGCLGQELYNASGGRVNLFGHPYFRVAGDFGLYCWMPARNAVYAFSDWRVRAPRRDLMLYLASHERNPHYRWCADQNPGEPEGIPAETTVEARPPHSLPPSKHFRGIDVAVLRSGWLETDTAVGLKCGPRRVQAHQHLDANSFVLYAGESPIIDELECTEDDCRVLCDLLGSGGEEMRGDAKWGAAATIAHSTLLIGNAGQLVGKTEWGPWIPGVRGKTDAWNHGEIIARRAGARIEGFGRAGELSFAIGEAAPAYAPPVASFCRTVALVGCDTVLVADRLVSASEVSVRSLLHVPGEAEQVASDSVLIRHGRRRACLQLLHADGTRAPTLQVAPWTIASGEERHVISLTCAVSPPFLWIALCFQLGSQAAPVTISQCEQDRLVLVTAQADRPVEIALGGEARVSLLPSA
jgi:hypothetical protein